MSGISARKGFLYQDYYLLKRLLSASAGRMDELWTRGGAEWSDRGLSRFGIEARSIADDPSGESRDWDVVVETSDGLELIEVKSGELKRSDALAFFARLRRESWQALDSSRTVIPVLVVDPEKAGELLVKLRGLSAAVLATDCVVPAKKPTGNITNVAKLGAVALWALCGEGKDLDGAPYSPEAARALLARIVIHECTDDGLQREVDRLLALFFVNGLDDQQAAPLLGWLSQRAVTLNPERHFCTIRELLGEMGVLGSVSAFDGATLRAWRQVWDTVGVAVEDRTPRCLGRSGEAVLMEENQPEARQVLLDMSVRRVIVTAIGGAGKSVVLRQLAERARSETRSEVLWCGAADVKTTEEIDDLERACRFRASVLAWRAPDSTLSVLVDALDEATDGGIMDHWAKVLARLGAVENVRVIVSVREEVWRRSKTLGDQMGSWSRVALQPWPSSLVERLLNANRRYSALGTGMREILRTPILLDLFWRTFVEDASADESSALPETGHGVMAAFWERRLLGAARHRQVGDLAVRSLALWGRAADQIGAFPIGGELAEIADIAVSEGVLVRTGRLQPKFGFRHPLLRDFALAQWCLGAGGGDKAVARWRNIPGGVARRGVLRALLEALVDQRAAEDWPEVSVAGLVHAIAMLGVDLAEELARFLGAREARAEYDPARWPASVQEALPPRFGASLIVSARLAGEASWAKVLAGWGQESAWLDEQFPRELVDYTDSLAERLRGQAAWAEETESAARYLRRLAECRRFETVFRWSDSWLIGRALAVVAGVLPDSATLDWAERELKGATWRVRVGVLQGLGDLAKADAARAAAIYRQAVGLRRDGDGFHIRKESWQGLMSHHALEWTLGGEDRRVGLLREFPEAFFPVAAELIEALWRDGVDERRNIEVSFTPLTEEQVTEFRVGEGATALIDDMPPSFHWHGFLRHGLREKAWSIVYKAAKEWAARDLGRFARAVAHPLRRSRMASIQGLVLDVMEDHRTDPNVAALRLAAAKEPGLYRLENLAYWSGRLLEDFGEDLPVALRADLDEFLRKETARPEEYKHAHALYLLGRLPAEAWPDDLRAVRPSDGNDEVRTRTRPRWSMDREAKRGAEVDALLRADNQQHLRAPGIWPDCWDRAKLDEFYRVTRHFDCTGGSPKEKAEYAAEAAKLALSFFGDLELLRAALLDEKNSWCWQALEMTMKVSRGERDEVLAPLPPELVRGAAALALAVVEQVPEPLPGKMPEGDVWGGCRESLWTRALGLVDEAMTWPPARDDAGLCSRFSMAVEAILRKEHEADLPQMYCVVHVRIWHWMRWRFGGEVGPWLVWRQGRHPEVLKWALDRLLHSFDDAGRVAVIRHVLGRRFEFPSGELAGRLGDYVGAHAMAWYGDRRSAVVALPDEILDAPERFPLLEKVEDRRRFWRGFAFGMKNQAKSTVQLHDLSHDFGRWALAVWRALRSENEPESEESRGSVVLFALSWLSDAETKALDGLTLRPWWNELRPLFREVAECGALGDCFWLFFNLRDQDYHHLVTVDDVLGWTEALMGRFHAGEGSLVAALDEQPNRGSDGTWRECLGYAASAIGALGQSGRLSDERLKERACTVLTTMQAAPLNVPDARTALHRLLNDN